MPLRESPKCLDKTPIPLPDSWIFFPPAFWSQRHWLVAAQSVALCPPMVCHLQLFSPIAKSSFHPQQIRGPLKPQPTCGTASLLQRPAEPLIFEEQPIQFLQSYSSDLKEKEKEKRRTRRQEPKGPHFLHLLDHKHLSRQQ